jgi:hypothetical protein
VYYKAKLIQPSEQTKKNSQKKKQVMAPQLEDHDILYKYYLNQAGAGGFTLYSGSLNQKGKTKYLTTLLHEF